MARFRTVIPIIRFFVGQEYNITVRSIGIDIVLGSTDVIRSVVESGDIVAVHAVTFDENPLGIMRRGIACTLN
jgi:predicted nuclease with TOPRIM domain